MTKTRGWLLGILTLGTAAILVHTEAYAQHNRRFPEGVVFFSARDGHPNNQIYVMDRNGNRQTRVTFDTASDVDPDISPDGQEIVFTSNETETGNNNIFIRDRWGSVRNLTNDSASDEWARWSP